MDDRQRLFFALWPDEALRRELTPLLKLYKECGGRAYSPGNLHITLSFLGSVDSSTRDCLVQAAGEITAPPFQLNLDRFGYWPRPRVVWLGCSEIPPTLTDLVERINRLVEQCGLQPERRPYQPHLTLLRKAQRGPAATAPNLAWEVDAFALVESVSTQQGVEYRVLRRWPLMAEGQVTKS